GDLSVELFEKTAAQVTGIDFCRPMLELAQAKAPHLRFVEGDALRLPFSDAAFDCVTVAFALRNLASVEQGLAELNRVLKPGGMIAVLEFSQPTVPGIRHLVRFYYWRLLPWIGGLLSGLRSAYEYLPDSISRFPDQQTLASLVTILIELVPGDPAVAVLGEQATPEQLAQFRAKHGLDRPPFFFGFPQDEHGQRNFRWYGLDNRYDDYWVAVLHGDLGKSFRTDQPVVS